MCGCELGYRDRYWAIHELFLSGFGGPYLYPVIYHTCSNLADVESFEANTLSLGYEGIILRSLTGPYKFGRSTKREGHLLKLKRTEDAEAEILELVELEHNLNEQTTDERGYAKRSSHAENKYHSGMLGSFWVRGINGIHKGAEFAVSAGSMTHEARRTIWASYQAKDRILNPNWIAPVLTYTFAKHRNGVNAPLEPRFKAFRKDI